MTRRHARFSGLVGIALAMMSVPTDALQDAPTTGEDAGIAQIFARHDLNGTIVIVSMSSNQRFIHNDPRAARPEKVTVKRSHRDERGSHERP